ncbi:MAG: AMP-binding protein [Flavobacteriales bacterium]
MFTLKFAHCTLSRAQMTAASPVLDGWEKEVLTFARHWDSSPRTITVHTSGSTGTPKPIELHTPAMRRSAEITIAHFGLVPGTRALLCLPIRYIAGKMMVVRALVGQWELVAAEPSLTPLEGIDQDLDFVAMTPLQVERSLDANPACFERVRTLIIGGAPVGHLLRKRLQPLLTACYATYGMTETCTHVAVQRLNGPTQTDHFEALPGYVFGLDNRNCLTINFDHLVGNVIITNDRVEMVEFGKFNWIGRTDSTINSAGVKVYPEKIEAVISTFFDRRFYISSRADDSFGENVVLVVEGEPLSSARHDELYEDMRDLLSPFEVPKSIEYLPEFSRTETGKIKRQTF